MAGYKIAIRHLLQREIKVPKGKLPPYMALTRKFQSNKCGSSSQQGRKLYSDKVIADGYDTKLTAFEVLIPALILSFEKIT
jgi:hypothetical protein